MDNRTILAIVLSLAVVLIYQMYFVKPPSPNKQSDTQKKTAISEQAEKQAEVTGSKGLVRTKTITSQQETIKEKDVFVETTLYTAVFTTKGGALKSFKLKNYYKTLPRNRLYLISDLMNIFRTKKVSADKDAELIELVDVKSGMPKPLSISFPESNIDIPLIEKYEANVDSLNMITAPDKNRLTFSRKYPNNMKIEKVFTFHPGKYNLDLEVRVYNMSGIPLNQNACLSWYQYIDPKAETDSYGHEGPVSFIAKDINRLEIKKIEKDQLLGPDVSWGGFESKYFIASMIPQNPSLTSLFISKDAREMVSVSLKGPKNLIPSGQAGLFSYVLFLGPKDHTILKEQGIGLENAIDFESWMPGLKWLSMSLLLALKFINQYIHNFGIAIIILTLLIKILFWPLGNMSYKSMKEMQKLQPKIAEIQQKYKDDRAKIGQETMALYKSHKVNPLSGCFPMLIQIPVFFGFYTALLYSIELRHAPFFWWIQDLSSKDPYYITPIIMGATMFIQQKMSPPMGDPMQAKLMMWMPVIFTFLFLNFSSGLVIYWLFNNIISIGQQLYINRRSS